jgi:hypothetical protein
MFRGGIPAVGLIAYIRLAFSMGVVELLTSCPRRGRVGHSESMIASQLNGKRVQVEKSSGACFP